MNGILVVNKPTDITSRDVVNKLCKIFKTKKIGHTGTLDPLATGVLIVCIGSYTKLVDFLTSKDKEYIATFKLGIETDTLDITGEILSKEKIVVDENKLKDVINNFEHQYNQEVPSYSAIKVNGKKLYEYARNNEYVKLPIKEVTIHSLELLNIHNEEITIRTKVSKGTYIRSLIRDIGLKYGTKAVMTSLIRTKQGEFNIENSYTLEDISNNNYQFVNLEYLLKNFPHLEVEDVNSVRNGVLINNNNEYVVITYNNQIIALYEKSIKYPGKIKPLIIF